MDSPLLDKSSPTFSQERWTTAKGSIYSLDYLIVLLAAKGEGHSLTSMLFTLHSSLVVSVNIRKSVGSHTVPRIHWGLYQCNISTCPPPRALQELISTAISSPSVLARVICTYITALACLHFRCLQLCLQRIYFPMNYITDFLLTVPQELLSSL